MTTTPPANGNASAPASAVNKLPQFPYHPQGIVRADPAFHRPLYKAMKMAMKKGHARRMGSRHKGILISPDIHITEKKIKWY